MATNDGPPLDAAYTLNAGTDKLEGQLLNLLRGSGPHGLRGVQVSRRLHGPHGLHGEPPTLSTACNLVRPLLLLTREQTARLCQERGLPVWLDSTNEDKEVCEGQDKRVESTTSLHARVLHFAHTTILPPQVLEFSCISYLTPTHVVGSGYPHLII